MNSEDIKWMESNEAHLEKLGDWLNTEVKIVESDLGGKTYNGDIRELIYKLNRMMPAWMCAFIEKINHNRNVNVKQLIDDTVLPFKKVHGPDGIMDPIAVSQQHRMHVEVITLSDINAYKSNLLTLCDAILKLDADERQALHAMLCLRNENGQFLYDWRPVWGMLVIENRRKNGYVSVHDWKTHGHKPEDLVGLVSPWVKVRVGSSGGKRTKRHKRSGKRSGHKRSGKRSGHKRSGKRSGKR